MRTLRRKRSYEETTTQQSEEGKNWSDQFQSLISSSFAPVILDPYCVFLNFATGAWKYTETNQATLKPLTFFAAKHVHFSHPKFKSLVADFKYPFVVKHILEVENPFSTSAFNAKATQVSLKNSNDPNIRLLWHCSTLESMGSILNSGMDVKYAATGSFGTGLYFADCVEKANIYSDGKENLQRLRVMYRCQVILGKSKEYAHGQSNLNLFTNEQGYDSVQGEPRFCREYAVYNNNQIRVTHVFLYNLIDMSFELDYNGNFISGLMGNEFTSNAPDYFSPMAGEKAQMISPFVIQPLCQRPKLTSCVFRKTKNIPVENLQKDQLPLYNKMTPPMQMFRITKRMKLPQKLQRGFDMIRETATRKNCLNDAEQLIFRFLSKDITVDIFIKEIFTLGIHFTADLIKDV
jgi:hypothetical protein